MKLPWPQFYTLLWCWLNHLPISQSIKITELSELTIRRWFEDFRANIPDPDWLLSLKNAIQMDEAFFKGKAVIAAKAIESKKVILRVIPKKNIQKQNISQFVCRHIEPGSKLFTDGAAYYKGIQRTWPIIHQRDIHSKWEFSKTSQIEGLFGNLRTFIRRKYHHVTCSKLENIVAEFEANFNHPEIFENPHEYLKNSLFLVPTC
jgi:hypothetical protein